MKSSIDEKSKSDHDYMSYTNEGFHYCPCLKANTIYHSIFHIVYRITWANLEPI